jgi:hypothetical protein
MENQFLLDCQLLGTEKYGAVLNTGLTDTILQRHIFMAGTSRSTDTASVSSGRTIQLISDCMDLSIVPRMTQDFNCVSWFSMHLSLLRTLILRFLMK